MARHPDASADLIASWSTSIASGICRTLSSASASTSWARVRRSGAICGRASSSIMRSLARSPSPRRIRVAASASRSSNAVVETCGSCRKYSTGRRSRSAMISSVLVDGRARPSSI